MPGTGVFDDVVLDAARVERRLDAGLQGGAQVVVLDPDMSVHGADHQPPRHGLHVAVTLLTDAVPPLRRPLFWLGFAVTFAFFALLLRYGLEYAGFAARQRSTILRLPMYWVYMAVPVGAGLALAHMVLGLRAPPLWAATAAPAGQGAPGQGAAGQGAAR